MGKLKKFRFFYTQLTLSEVLATGYYLFGAQIAYSLIIRESKIFR